MTRPDTPNLVTKTGWWTASGTPSSVISWETSHPPEGMTVNGTGTFRSGQGTDELMVTFAAPPIPAVLPSRTLLIQTAGLANGRTVIRVDAQDTWLPAKPASETIPSAAVLTIRAVAPRRPRPTSPPSPTAPAVISVTDPAVIARVAQLIQALPRTAPGVRHCGAEVGTFLDLTFASAPHGPATATVEAAASGCGLVSVTVHGNSQPTLDGGPELIEKLESLLHVRWPTLH